MSFSKFRVDLSSKDTSKRDRKTSCSELEDHPSLELLRNTEAQNTPAQDPKTWFVGSYDHPLAKYLEDLSKQLLDLLCTQKFTDPLITKHLSADFLAIQDGHTKSRGREEHFAVCAKMMNQMPGYGWELVESIVEIHESEKKAKLWSFKRLTGLPGFSGRHQLDLGPGICKESVGFMKWELQGETWVCTRLKKLNGVSGLACGAGVG